MTAIYVTMRVRNYAVAAALALIAAVACQVSAASRPAKNASQAGQDNLTPKMIESRMERLAPWAKRCQVATLDIRWVPQSDLRDSDVTTQALACSSFAKNPSPPAKAESASRVGGKALDLSGTVRAIHAAVLQTSTPVDALCRSAVLGDSSKTFVRRCELFLSVIREKQGSAAFCKRARALGIADAHYGCAPSDQFLDADPNRCLKGEGASECREMASLLRALRSGDPKECALSPFCRVLASHDARDCDSYLAKANKEFCDAIASEFAQLRKAAAENARFEREKEEQRQRLELEKKRQADAREAAELARKSKKNFKKGEPMQAVPPDVEKRLKLMAPKPEGK